MADKVNVISITGSLRKGSFNAALARQLPKWQPAGMTITPAPDWRDLPVYNADDQNSTGFPATATKLADAIRAADGVLFVTPEYNYGIPGGLKNAIDWVSRMKDHLRQAMVFLNAFTFNTPEIFVGSAPSKFDENHLEFKDEAGIKFITQQLAAFEAFIRKLTGK